MSGIASILIRCEDGNSASTATDDFISLQAFWRMNPFGFVPQTADAVTRRTLHHVKSALKLDCATCFMDDLFLKSGFPRLYEHVLRLPIIRSIRRQEQQTLLRTFAENLGGAEQVLEVGAGTGFYTFEIARRVQSVTALERSPGMTRILRERIANAQTPNITVVESDFSSYAPCCSFDVVIAIGVLDCVTDAKMFLARCISLATKGVIVTIPRSSFWASIHSFFGGMMGVHISVYTPEEIASYLRGYRYTLAETGLRTSWTRGLTLVGVIKTSPE